MRRFLFYATTTLAALFAGGAYLWDYYIGFPRPALEKRFPQDVYLYGTVPHLRLAALIVSHDEQLKATAFIAQALALAISDAASLDETSDTGADFEWDQRSAALLRELAHHFRTQLSFALLPPSEPGQVLPDLLIASSFFGNESKFQETLYALTTRLSHADTRLSWEQTTYANRLVHSLDLSQVASIPSQDYHAYPIELSWTILDGALFFANSREAIVAAIDRDLFLREPQSLAADPALAELSTYAPDASVVIQLRNPMALDWINQYVVQREARSPSYLSAISLPRIFQSLGLSDLSTLTAAYSFDQSKAVYLGFRYSGSNGYLGNLHPIVSPDELPRIDQPRIQTSATVGVDLGTFLVTTKNAILTSPAAALGYLFLNSKTPHLNLTILDELLESSFSDQLSLLLTLDTATARSDYGALTQSVALDFALQTDFENPSTAQNLVRSIFSEIVDRYPQQVRLEERESETRLYLNSDYDPSVTSSRLGMALEADRLTIGFGTLRSFETLSDWKSQTSFAAPPQAPALIGSGQTLVEQADAALQRLSIALYDQLNPGQPLPDEFSNFDWSQLSPLATRRAGKLINDGDGHLYWISEQL
ncbi:hypothetical protein [Pelagicoccus sp. SDUM812003]|uniref:hypothetical protein n=1 Tax=Pelagicoccus sp. SDUM812003 TaxID=3041267 RepID=UPI00280FD0B1|nr:hypothetical protein [Pelagicoccus sp. SDUM812003]MDQ8203316.1 hypothetical protein [Pelagicoccus sp. SDUM812003]